MKVRFAKSIKAPVLNSYFISGFSPETLEMLKRAKPFTIYHNDLKEYELPKEIYLKIKEPVESFKDETVEYPRYELDMSTKYAYQDSAVEFARKTDNIFLNFAQGLGKSFTTMKILKDEQIKRTLIVCGQSNLQEEWIKDALKHGCKDDLSMEIVGDDTGASTLRKLSWLSKKGLADGVDLINIEALRTESIVNALNDRNYECIVVDEVQSAKGWKAQQTEGLHTLIRWKGQKRIALSGTPILNSPLEFFSLLKFLGMLGFTARTTFERYYGDWGFDFWGHWVCSGYKNLDELAELVKPVIATVSKDVLGLPKKTRIKKQLEHEATDRFIQLSTAYKMSTNRLKKTEFTSKPQIRAELQFLSSTEKSKMDFVENHSQLGRILVFSQYTKVLEQYKQHLANKGIKVLFYHGALSMTERLSVLQKWREGDYNVLLLSVMAARYGLNLTEATEVIFLEPPTSLAVLEQAEDRAHRIGQEKPVVSYILSTTELDENALETIVKKQEAIDAIGH